MEDCLFCKIIAGEIPSTKVYENDKVYAFRDIAPAAPEHVVIVPKAHICCANKITSENSSCVADIFEAIPEIAKTVGVAEDGYRIVNNCGKNGGQTVMHLHFHLLGGSSGGKMY
ncbi:MAG: histidine triad nucleotide-binding protein [Oscillospiraceae bacterium]|nr:histidine triad nucleotide-binding protein [Oscillospiraceae bacterium]